jgi:murein DD-endopeptidase MepM/ murein hydrolase activator NlpD
VSVFLAFGLVIPSTADAGMLDSLSALFSSKIEYTTDSGYNSQTIPLPRPAYNVDPNPSKGGGDILVRNGSALVAESGPVGGASQFSEGITTGGQISVYIVREGDTLGEIAETFGVSTNTIKWANDIKSGSTISIGQKLVILPITGIKYTIKNGGTLRDVIKKHGGSIEEAAEYNGIGPDEDLAKGTVVIIPNGEIATPTLVKKTTRRVTSAARNVSSVALSGYFVDPLNHAGTRTQGIHGYNAVDIGARTGTPIIASASGKVILARASGWNGGYGLYTIIKHPNGTQTVYAHMSENISYIGQSVVQGQVIGYVGNTGRSTGSHLHFEVRGAKNPF